MSSKNLPYILLLLLCLSSSSGSALLAYSWSTGGDGGEGDASGDGGEGDAGGDGGEGDAGGDGGEGDASVPCQGSWSEWSGCSKPCGGGTKTKTWTTSPGGEPLNGGTACPSPTTESADCNTQACPSTSPAPQNCQGSWSGWSGWSDCSATCGGGIKTRTKTWTTSPGGESRYGGAACPPNKKEEEECNTQACSVNWDGSTTNTSGSPIWEEFPSLKLSGTKLSSGGGDISPADCKQKCIENSACGGILTKSGKKCFLYGGDAMPNPTTVGEWWVSYTLVR
jgi:hypothetical protein